MPAHSGSPPGSPGSRSSPLYSQLRKINRPDWDTTPRCNPPGDMRYMMPVTKEPWTDVQKADMALRMDFGSRAALGLAKEELRPYNGLVEEARRRRLENAASEHWDRSTVRHQPRVLRGQKCDHRAEPWSKFHNDFIGELNAIPDTNVNEIFAITANRDNGVRPTLVQPPWNANHKMVPVRWAHKDSVEVLTAVKRRATHCEAAEKCRGGPVGRRRPASAPRPALETVDTARQAMKSVGSQHVPALW